MIMVQEVLRFILWLTVTPFGQETVSQWSTYPACSRKCVTNALESSGCHTSGFECLCASHRLLEEISACALLVCSKEDFDQTYSVLEKNCKAINETIKVKSCAFKISGEEILATKKDQLIELHVLDLRAVSGAATTSTSSTSASTSQSTRMSVDPTTTSIKPKTLEVTSSSSVSTTSSAISSSPSSTSTISASNTPLTSSSPPSASSSTTSRSKTTIDPSSSTSTTSSIPTSSTTNLPVLTLSTPTTATPAATFTPATTSFPLPSIVPCTDPKWQLTPENWKSLNVDLRLQETKSKWGSGVGTFLEFVGNFTGSQGLHCGIGTAQTCTMLQCSQFQQAGAEPWQYLVAFAVVQINVLINVLHQGISEGKEDLALVIIAMANDFYEWKNPQTTTNKAAPWLAAMLTAVLAFIPLLFPFDLELATISGSAGAAAAAFASGGLQTLAATANPETFLLSNMETLGLFVKEISTNATTMLETWSGTLYDGKPDASGNTIIDYMSGGRFAFTYDIKQSDVETYFFQTVVSDVVNDQLVSNTSNSKTFVMCGDGNVPCTEESFFSENGKSCCLYRFADNNTYIEPPEVIALKSSKYDYINASSVVASSFRSYQLQALDYNQSDTNAFINSSLSSPSLRDQPFIQGPSAAGIWTLPVCYVGTHSDWVADYSALMMPCCCGPSCSQTVEFFHKAHLAGNSKINDLCAKQYKPFSAVSGGRSLEVPTFGIGVVYLVFALVGFL